MLSQEEYQTRRNKLAAELPPDSLALIPAAEELIRNGDSHYRFRQDSNFYYLTGFNEPQALLAISSEPSSQSTLFNRSFNPLEEQWTGKRLGQEGAVSHLLMDKAFPMQALSEELPKLLSGKSHIYYALGKYPALEEEIKKALKSLKSQARKGIKAPHMLTDLEAILGELRLFKTEAEINLMRKAAEISVKGHLRAMRISKKAAFEYELEAELIHEFSSNGCRAPAYDSIVGSGDNACTLHYTDNNKPLKSGELVLIDAGCEYEHYAADITRTFPINGIFSPEQKAIYELVLKAYKAGVAMVKPGQLWNSPQQKIIKVLTTGLCELGILKGEVDKLIADEAYKVFYMHNSGHWLGMDVHDVGSYKINGSWRPFQPGMVLTVEPGLYISPNTPHVDKKWWGIGVRIEDDILVTESGHEVLTGALPIEIEEIEALMRD